MNKETPKYVGPKPMNRLMNKDEIKIRFDNETASAYSQEDPIYLPDYASTFELLIDCINKTNEPMQVLDLGAGTRNLTMRLLRRNKNCHIRLVDFSKNMLDVVSVVLKEYPNNFTNECNDFTQIDYEEGSYDAVISSFAIHHTRSIEEYTDLYKKIHKWLKPGGIFACVDVVNGFNMQWTIVNGDGWKKYLKDYFNEEKINQIFANYHAEDSQISLPEHMNCLHKAGFTDADILWKRYNFSLYCARK